LQAVAGQVLSACSTVPLRLVRCRRPGWNPDAAGLSSGPNGGSSR